MRALLVLVLVACAAPPSSRSWWAGHWASSDGGEEHWVEAGGVLYGVGFSGDSFELMVVDDHFTAMPGGTRSVEFRPVTSRGTTATFENPRHDDPKSITYTRSERGLTATLAGTQVLTFSFTPASYSPAPALEAKDRAGGKRVLASGRRGGFGYTVGIAPHGSYATIWKQANSDWTIAFEARRQIRSP